MPSSRSARVVLIQWLERHVKFYLHAKKIIASE
jgi:hypothetical protein